MTFFDKEQVKRNFGQSSPTYDQYAHVQKSLAQELVAMIKMVGKEFSTILEIGCGTGFLTEALAKNFPHAKILAVDISPQMLQVAQDKLSLYANVTYLVGDGENLKIPACFDLITSSAVFQWFNDCRQSFAAYRELLVDGGYFIFNILGEQTYRELWQSLQGIGLGSPKRSGMTAEELARTLSFCGFTACSIDERLLRDYHQSARELLLGIKKSGAHSTPIHGHNGHLKGTDIFRLANFLNSHFRDEQGVWLTYHILCALSRKSS